MSTAHADRYERQQQALKGLVRTLPAIRDRYCRWLCDTALVSTTNSPGMRHIEMLIKADGEIFEAVSGINSLHACIGLSVVSLCTAAVLRELPGVQNNPDIQRHLAPLDAIVERKVWSVEERRKLFGLCFRILQSFNGEFAHLVDEVKQNFAEETQADPENQQ